MTKKNITDTCIKGLKIVASIAVSAAIGEVGYLGGRMLCNDVHYTVKEIDKKINPIEMRKKAWYKKAEPYNARTKTFLSDKKSKDSKKSK